MADLKGDAHAKDGQVNPCVIRSPLYGNKTDGKAWTDGDHSQINKITAIQADGIFTGIQLDYVDARGKAHGSKDRNGAVIFPLNPGEVLQKITGYYGTDNYDKVKIKYLKFTTNTQELPPVGVYDLSDTSFEIKGSKIIGLFGRGDDAYVYAIGADYEH